MMAFSGFVIAKRERAGVILNVQLRRISDELQGRKLNG